MRSGVGDGVEETCGCRGGGARLACAGRRIGGSAIVHEQGSQQDSDADKSNNGHGRRETAPASGFGRLVIMAGRS